MNGKNLFSSNAQAGVSQSSVPPGNLQVLKNLDKFLYLFIIVSFSFLARELASGPKYLPPLSSEFGTETVDLATEEFSGEKELQPFSDYRPILQQRNIFEPIQTVPPAINPPPVVTPPVVTPNVPDLVNQLKLVGIVLGDEAEAIVEDMGEKETYFLRVGDKIREATLEEIEEGRVILRYNNQQVEIVQ